MSLVFATMAALATLLIGSTVGLMSGFALGWTDSVLMRFADVLLSIPAISILVLVSSIYRPGYFTLAMVFSLLLWPGISRIVRGETIAIRNQPYIDAARVNGASNTATGGTAYSAECVADHVDLGVAGHPRVHHHGGRIELSGTRRAATPTVVGKYVARSAELLHDQLDQCVSCPE